MPNITVGIIDPFEPSILAEIEDALPSGWSLSVAAGKSASEHEAALRDADIAFVMATPVPDDLLRSASRLGFVQKMGAGVDKINLDVCAERGIGVARLYAGNAIPVAEHTVMLILASYRRLPILDRDTRAGKWDKELSRSLNRHLHGKTVGIVGFGAIGRAVARVLSGFGVRIIYFDPMSVPEGVALELGATYCPLDELLAEADVVTLHLPLMEQTRGLIGRERIARMKSGALLVNCARGGLVDEDALGEALSSGRLFGAAIDAFAVEPPLGNPLLALANTIVTPHCAGATIDNFANLAQRAVANAKLYLAGKPLPADDCVLQPDATLRKPGLQPHEPCLMSRPFMIANQWVEGRGTPFASISPADGSEVAQICAATAEDVDDAVKAARRALADPAWSKLKNHQRARYLEKFSDAIAARKEHLARVQMSDNGKTLAECRSQVDSAADTFRYYAAVCETAEGEITTQRGSSVTMTVYEPAGVVAAITPWNSPLTLEAQKLAPILAAGNSVILKPSEVTPQIALEYAQIAIDVGLPAGVVNVVTGAGDIGRTLVDHPGVDMISFTGGTAAGRAIAEAAGRRLAPVILELGGKSPNIVFADADLTAAAKGVAAGIFSSGRPVLHRRLARLRPGADLRAFPCPHEGAGGNLSSWHAGFAGNPDRPDGELSPSRFRRVRRRIGHRRGRQGDHWRRGAERPEVRRGRLFPGNDPHRRHQPGTDQPGRTVRSGCRRDPLRGRGRPCRSGQRQRLRARRRHLDVGLSQGLARRACFAGGNRVDQYLQGNVDIDGLRRLQAKRAGARKRHTGHACLHAAEGHLLAHRLARNSYRATAQFTDI